jgi:hypothetical protein
MLESESIKPSRIEPTVSAVLANGSLVEMVYDPKQHKTGLAVWNGSGWTFEDFLNVKTNEKLVPYSPRNNLIKNQIILFPSEPCEYGTEAELLREIQSFIHRYVDLSPVFEKIASYYVLFSWIYDGFNELPYLRVRGDPGCGKTRFLLIVGSICFKPIFASGASTVSPIFRMLENFQGTLVIDESDFRFSDEKAEMVKILNNGNVRGFPVLRSETSGKGEFNPRAYHVFGPKLVATRGPFEDRALESRFLTEEMGQRSLRTDIPINLTGSHEQEALALRNKLLLFRFRNFGKKAISPDMHDRSIEPRLNQVFAPLLAVIDDVKIRRELIRGLMAEPQTQKLTIMEITNRFSDLFGSEYERKVTSRWIGFVIRKRLGLKTERTRDGFVVTAAELSKLERLYLKFGLAQIDADEPDA